MNYKRDGFTVVGTDINEVKRKNVESGMSYNGKKAKLEKTNSQSKAINSVIHPNKVKTENKLNM
ncbi:gamma-type small acid-soluble spore protein [Rummeliibacillus pycnus]|uniref:gamma-type small acid-soluble spore protein n=1 Tax=Rummeliibacillus pycnus TaxID=101070 RepID=UPI003D2D81AC